MKSIFLYSGIWLFPFPDVKSLSSLYFVFVSDNFRQEFAMQQQVLKWCLMHEQKIFKVKQRRLKEVATTT